jgi:hypothetical protein
MSHLVLKVAVGSVIILSLKYFPWEASDHAAARPCRLRVYAKARSPAGPVPVGWASWLNAPDKSFDRIFYGKPVPILPENALMRGVRVSCKR